MFTFLLVVQALIATSLVGVILMQQSEGGGLGMGGSPTGLMSARGAANFLTRATGILAVTFVMLSIILAIVATQRSSSTAIDTSLARKPVPVAPAPVVPLSGDPAAVPAPATTPAGPSTQPVVPLAASPRPQVERKITVPATRPVVTQGTKPAVERAVAPPPIATTVPKVSSMPTPAPVNTGNSN